MRLSVVPERCRSVVRVKHWSRPEVGGSYPWAQSERGGRLQAGVGLDPVAADRGNDARGRINPDSNATSRGILRGQHSVAFRRPGGLEKGDASGDIGDRLGVLAIRGDRVQGPAVPES